MEINKIKVTPRSKGDNVFDGVIYIVEDFWSIHSVDLNSTKMGIRFHISQIYNPIEDSKKLGRAWMPITQNFKVGGSVFGFEFEGQYLATVKDYKLFLNPALKHEITVVDEKKVPPVVVAKSTTKTQKTQVIKQKLSDGKEVTNKELNQLIKQIEKEEQKKLPEPEVLSDRSFKVDSTARKKDSVFWVEMRPAPLEKEEVRGYHKADSLAVVEKKKEDGDSLKGSKSKGFQPWDLLLGDRYKLGKTTDFEIRTPYGGFNTVEGFNLIYRVSLYKRWVKRDSLKPDARPKVTRLEITPVVRYSFEREKFMGFLRTDWRNAKSRITLEAGRYVTQFNSANPIQHFQNTATSLLAGYNFMKIYERDFTDLTIRHRFNDQFTFFSTWTYSQRRELLNNTAYTFFKDNKDHYTPNSPVNNELTSTSFATHQAFTGMARLEMRPWVKYRIRNGSKHRVDGSSPLFSMEYRKGFKNIGGSDVEL
jgi:hypothetical protein